MSHDHARYLHGVAERTGLEPAAAAAAVTATFEALGRALRPAAAGPVAALLPEPLAVAVTAGARTEVAATSFVADLAAHEQVGLGFAREHAQVILEQIAGELEPATQALLRERVGERAPEAAAWLHSRDAPESRRGPAPGSDRTLAGGRPGSPTPLSAAQPPAGQHDSVAANPDPHAETKLASSEGVSTERDHDTLAEGRPGSHEPLV